MDSIRSQHDPRLGDEPPLDDHDREELSGGDHADHHHRPTKHVRMDTDQPTNGHFMTYPASPLHEKSQKPPLEVKVPVPQRPSRLSSLLDKIPFDLQWIPANFTWSKLKPVIRCAFVAWVSIVFVVISKTELVLGQASFLILIGAFIDPPAEPFIAVLEKKLILITFVTIGWAWACLGIFFAHLARRVTVTDVSFASVITGQYIEAGPTVIMAVFIFFGSATFLWIRARQGPGPFLFGTIFGCICLDISLTSAALFPYPYYLIGRTIAVPLAFHCAFSILFSALIFPSTITAQYAGALVRVLDPLHAALHEHREILKLDPSSQNFLASVSKISGLVGKSENGLTPAAAALRLLKQDVVYGRFSPANVGGIQWWIRRLVTRTHGMGLIFTLIDPTREKFPVTPAPSRPSTPGWGTPVNSRPSTPVGGRSSPSVPGTPRGRTEDLVQAAMRRRNPAPAGFRRSLSRHLHFRLQEHEQARQDNHLHFSLLHLAHSLSASSLETAVGVFESQRYLALEARRLGTQDSPENTQKFVHLLGESCDELLGSCAEGLKGIQGWIGEVRSGSFSQRETIEKMRADRLAALFALRSSVGDVVERFRSDKRHRVLDPYRSAFDPKHVASGEAQDPPPHKYLFHCYLYQYHAMQFGILVVDLLNEIIRLEKEQLHPKLWTPTIPLAKLFEWSRWEAQENMDQNDDEDPEVIQGMDSEWSDDLGMVGRRDPDALPPQNIFQFVMYYVYFAVTSLGRGNVLYALKAGLLTVILCLPSFLKSSAQFAYGQRFVWGIFMGQLTLARFRGDTTFGLVARIISTFLGGVVGMVMWYVSAGSGRGNGYGLAAVCGVCFPFFYYARLYWPGPPMTNIIFFVTAALVIGYSWQDTHHPVGFIYWGFDLAWRRFVLVTAGVFAAFIFSFLPPSTTLRRYQRTMMSTTVAELGSVYCSIISFASTRGREELDKGEIIQSLIAIRMKLKRSLVLRTNIIYEFSLRGKWPAERYHRILELQTEIAFLLSHLMSIAEHLEPAWSRAFLLRTRFNDSDFQGDVLAVISMISTALRTGNPLPQITPCPLLDRFMVYTHGLNVIRQEADDDYGLPRTMTIDTLENEQYLCFTVGVTTAFGLILRLDKLMVATKELVGEQYHIQGIGLPRMDLGEHASNNSARPAKDV